MEAVGRFGGADLELEHCFAGLVGSLVVQISTEAFLDVGIAGFYYENPANDLSDDENLVQESVSDDGDILIDDGENDDGSC